MPSTPRTIDRSEADRIALEGPHSRRRELWLVLRALRDFIHGFRALHFVGPCVTVFGSARCGADHPYYAVGRDLGARLARLGFTVMTGGCPGLMEAANRGAREAGGRSVGCNVKLPTEQHPNAYLDRSVMPVSAISRRGTISNLAALVSLHPRAARGVSTITCVPPLG